ncbi:MAG: methyltransferase domain-containing protein [Desulfobulbus sp.]|nr:methyltransferase domain-containing protein [Desulfobulbus sp.]
MKHTSINFPLLLIVSGAIALLGYWGFTRLHIDTDIVKTLPTQERVITDALEIFRNHPIFDQVAVDVSIDRKDPDLLVACGKRLAEIMRVSGLFAEVGANDVGALVPELALRVAGTLPLLFSHEELETIAPRLAEEAIRQRLQSVVEGLSGLEGIGQAAFFSLDPLGFKDQILAKLIHLAPSQQVTFYKGHLLSQDGRHLLVTARPTTAGTDGETARKLAAFFSEAGQTLSTDFAPAGIRVTLTPAGAFRAALDNETIIDHDVQLALGVSVAAIALLLLLAFPRPLVGLLCLFPVLAGSAIALFIYSLFNASISVMVLGFAGALISILNDHSITYLLFLDRPHATRGGQVAKEVRSIGQNMAVLTAIGAFLVISLSDFPIYRELGQFTALGLTCTYLCIHLILPRIFKTMPASSNRALPLQKVADRLFRTGKTGAAAALALAVALLFFAKPEFRISLSEMSTVSKKTQADDRMFTEVWGNIGAKVYLMTTAASMADLQATNDRLLARIEQDMRAGRVQSVFVPSMLLPGAERSRDNLAAWQAFWTTERVSQVKTTLIREGAALGLTAEAFVPFFAQLDSPDLIEPPVFDSRYNQLLGITTGKEGRLIQFTPLSAGKKYNAAAFFETYGQDGKIFDANYFSDRLGAILFSTFVNLLVAIAVMVSVLVFLQFLNWRLTLITVTPLVFAFICTLGTLKLIGHPLDIPALMLSVVILGIGADFAILTVRGCQWYGTVDHPGHLLVRSAVFMAAASNFIGFGVLCFAQHASLKSIGISSLLGIGYALLGAFLLLPPLLRAFFREGDSPLAPTAPFEQRILHRYRLLEPYSRMFARFKLKFDPLFAELPQWLDGSKEIRTIVDIGCGYGVPACWCLERFPASKVIGLDPAPDRVRVATRATGTRGTILVGAAPDLPDLADPADLILLLDMSHFLDDRQLIATCTRCQGLLAPGGLLLLRFVTRPEGSRSATWHFEDWRARRCGQKTWYRRPEVLQRMLTEAGLVELHLDAAINRELFWLSGRRPGAPAT